MIYLLLNIKAVYLIYNAQNVFLGFYITPIFFTFYDLRISDFSAELLTWYGSFVSQKQFSNYYLVAIKCSNSDRLPTNCVISRQSRFLNYRPPHLRIKSTSEILQNSLLPSAIVLLHFSDTIKFMLRNLA